MNNYYSVKMICRRLFSLVFLWMLMSGGTTALLKAEGSREITPNTSNFSALVIIPSIGSGSFLGAPQENRIYFNINNLNERLYFGTNWYEYGTTSSGGAYVGNTMYARIYDPNGNQVGGNIQLSNTSNPTATTTGHIADLTRAQNGPNIGSVNNGYNPLTFTPSTTGEHYIVFYRSTDGGNTSVGGTNWFKSIYFDFTVATTSGVKRNGRVFSHKWGFVAINTNLLPHAQASVSPTFYSYSLDSTISRITFEPGFMPIAYDVAINDYGVENTGNWAVDRRSINRSGSPSLPGGYKLFLNRPDSTIYTVPTIEAQPYLANPPLVGCGAPYQIRFIMPAAGDARILLDLNGVAGYQHGTVDRIIEVFNVEAGLNVALWDGLNGQGGSVASGTNIKITATYQRGRFNIPIYDAEINKNGFNVAAIAPIQTTNTILYWDDRDLTATGTCPASGADQNNNSTGPGINNSIQGTASPAHAWSGNGNPTQLIPAPAVGSNENGVNQCDDYGNVRVINSWGWALSVESNVLSMDFYCRYISGSVYNDVNGLTDNTVNGTLIGQPAGTKLYAILIDNNNQVIDSVAVKSNGTFQFAYAAFNNGNYSVLLSTTAPVIGQAPPANTLPLNWVTTGEYRGTTSAAGSDGNIDGRYYFNVNNADVTQIKFGIQQRPDAGTSTAPLQSNPGGTVQVAVAPSLFTPTDSSGGTISSIRITAFPANATSITINNITYTSTTFPVNGVTVPTNSNGNPVQPISVDPVDGAITVSIPYKATDNAGFESTNTGAVNLPFSLLSISKTSDVQGLYRAGDTITYTIVIKNDDSFSHTGVNLTDALPQGVSFVPGSVNVAVSSSLPTLNSRDTVSSGGYQVPAGVNSITVETWGGGGRGGSRTSGNSNTGFGGGGGGAYARRTLSVTPLSTYTVSVGTGSSSTSAGEDSWFSPNTVGNALVLAKGGNSVANNSTTGAAGGAAAGSIGDVTRDGGNGGNGGSGNTNGAGGGSSAGTASPGNNGLSNGNGGTAPTGGGNGGNGSSGNGSGSTGDIPGGGGGGARRGNSGSPSGGTGANGMVVISYSIPGTNGTTGNPPALASNWTILAGARLTATYKVVVNNPLTTDSVVNTASAVSNLITTPITSTVTDYPRITISGTVFNDVNGYTDSLINGTGFNNPDNTQLYAVLVDSTNKVIRSVPVSSNGSYTIPDVNKGTHAVVLTTSQPTTGTTLNTASIPDNWVYVGETIGATGARDNNPNGVVAVVVSHNNVDQVNLGIQKRPLADSSTLGTQLNPGGTNNINVPATAFGGSDFDGGTISAIIITAFPDNATSVTINGTLYTSGTFPSQGVTVPTNASGQPTQTIAIDPIDGNISVTIPYKTIDNGASSSSNTGIVTIPFVANTTYAVNDENSTWINTPVSGNVTTNDYDLEGNTQHFGSFLNPSETGNISSGSTVPGKDKNGNPVANAGTLSFDNNGNYTFNPAPGFTGNVTVPYNICDNGTPAACDTAYLDITVSPLPDQDNSVIANNDEYISYGNPVNGNITSNDADPQGHLFAVTTYRYDSNGDGTPDATGTLNTPVQVGGVNSKTGQPVTNAGTVNIQPDGSFTFVPAPGFEGEVILNYTICDNGVPVACDQATVTVTVQDNYNGPANDPPFAGDDFAYTSINTPVDGSFISNDYDPNGDPVSVNGITIVPGGPADPVQTLTTVQGGTIVLYTDGTYTYTPPTGYTGPDRAVYEICDVTTVAPHPLCAQATIHTLIAPGITISGKVWHDADGSVTQNNDEPTTHANAVLYANVINDKGKVIAVAAVDSNGYYSVSEIPVTGHYSVRLSTVQGVPGYFLSGMTLPAGWAYTGQNYNGTIIHTPLGSIPFSVQGNDIQNLDFGIELIPFAYPYATSVMYYPDIDSTIPVPFNYFTTADTDGTVDSIRLTTFPGNVSTISIDGTEYNYDNWPAQGLVIPTDANGQPTVNIWVVPSALYVDIVIPFASIDNANKQGEHASITIFFNSILPVELLYFNADQRNCQVNLQWATASELNNGYFTISRSTDFVNWVNITTVNGAGTSNSRHEYSYTDVPGFNGTVYYRLQQTDYDGTIEIFPAISVDLSACGNARSRVYPVPAQNLINIEVSGAGTQTGYLSVTDASGRTLKQVRYTGSLTQMDVSGLPSGNYYIRIDSDEVAPVVHKIIIAR